MALSLAAFSAGPAILASEDTSRDNCVYNGVKLDPGAADETATKKNKIPDSFSGQVVCFRVPEGNKQEEFWLKKGVRSGEMRHYDSNGRVDESTPYKDGVVHGIVKKYDHSKGILQSEVNFKDGNRYGLQKDFNTQTGALERVYFVNQDGAVDTDIQLNPKGQPTSLTCGLHSAHPEDSKWCGRNGRGSVKIYREDGSLRRTAEYLKGKLDGKVVELNDDDSVETSIYAKGEMLKSSTSKDKKVIAETNYSSKGQSDELEKVFFEGTKKLQAERRWENRQMVSEKLFWESGKLRRDWKMSKDRRVKLLEYWENGHPSLDGTYKLVSDYYWSSELPDGTIKEFDDSGLPIEIAEYKNGERSGTTKYFYLGKLVRLEKYGKFMNYAEDYGKNEKLIRKTTYNSDGSRIKEQEIK